VPAKRFHQRVEMNVKPLVSDLFGVVAAAVLALLLRWAFDPILGGKLPLRNGVRNHHDYGMACRSACRHDHVASCVSPLQTTFLCRRAANSLLT
jgi:hypothetical protein